MKTFDLPKDHGSNKTWMDVTLPSVEVFVKRNGFGLVSDPNQTSCSYFEIGAAMHEELGKATNELHIMFIAAAEYVLNHPELWKHFEFPPVFWEMAVKSFANRSETLTGRMDFSITEKHGIKCFFGGKTNQFEKSATKRRVILLNFLEQKQTKNFIFP